MLSRFPQPGNGAFLDREEARPAIEEARTDHPDLAEHSVIGRSEEGRDIDGVVLGRGPRKVSLIAGNHADEPVGPETLRHFVVEGLRQREHLNDLFEQFTFVIVPHVNPDGEAANRPWIERWPDPLAYFKHVVREPPGRDVEFGYPDMRPENRAVADFLAEHGPFDLHVSLHGMAVAEGAWLLIHKNWIERTADLRRRWLEAIHAAGLEPFDYDRGGEKGFHYIGPGFSTTPEGAAMRQHFERIGEPGTAAQFHDSSMEYARRLGGDPLCLVTELPLFVLRGKVGERVGGAGVPATYLRFKEALPRLRLMIERGDPPEAIAREVEPFQIESLALDMAMKLQLRAIELGLASI